MQKFFTVIKNMENPVDKVLNVIKRDWKANLDGFLKDVIKERKNEMRSITSKYEEDLARMKEEIARVKSKYEPVMSKIKDMKTEVKLRYEEIIREKTQEFLEKNPQIWKAIRSQLAKID
jgi:uncharacterized protein YicC (UPF0701 family)